MTHGCTVASLSKNKLWLYVYTLPVLFVMTCLWNISPFFPHHTASRLSLFLLLWPVMSYSSDLLTLQLNDPPAALLLLCSSWLSHCPPVSVVTTDSRPPNKACPLCCYTFFFCCCCCCLQQSANAWDGFVAVAPTLCDATLDGFKNLCNLISAMPYTSQCVFH